MRDLFYNTWFLTRTTTYIVPLNSVVLSRVVFRNSNSFRIRYRAVNFCVVLQDLPLPSYFHVSFEFPVHTVLVPNI